MNVILRRAAAAFFALHGLIHVMGFAVAWQLAILPEIAYRTSALNGAIEVGDTGTRFLGIGWLVGAAVFLAAAWGAWRNAPWAIRGAVLAAAVSTVVCALGLPDAYLGLTIDVAILVGAGLLVVGRSIRVGTPVR